MDRNSRARPLNGARGIIIAVCEGDLVELFEGGPVAEVVGGVGKRLELLVGRHDVGIAVVVVMSLGEEAEAQNYQCFGPTSYCDFQPQYCNRLSFMFLYVCCSDWGCNGTTVWSGMCCY